LAASKSLQQVCGQIFINYRREDTAAAAGRLFDHLQVLPVELNFHEWLKVRESSTGRILARKGFGSPLAFATVAKPTPMNTDITINGRLRSLFSALLMAIIALGARPGNAHAQIYVSQLGDGPDAGFVGEFDGTTGAAINANLITGLYGPVGLALSGNTLFVANYLDGTVGAYNASTGAEINANFITGLKQPVALALSADTLVVSDNRAGIVREYSARTGVAINANLITGLESLFGVALSDKALFVSNDTSAGTIGEYDATTGTVINAKFIAGSTGGYSLALWGDTLFVAQFGGTKIAKYNAITGEAINTNFINGLNQCSGIALGKLALSGNALFVVNNGAGTIGEYDAATGEAINTKLITGLRFPNGLVVAPNLRK
jgi:hypothetical protein